MTCIKLARDGLRYTRSFSALQGSAQIRLRRPFAGCPPFSQTLPSQPVSPLLERRLQPAAETCDGSRTFPLRGKGLIEPRGAVVGRKLFEPDRREDLEPRRRSWSAMQPVASKRHNHAPRRHFVRSKAAELGVMSSAVGTVHDHVVAVADLIYEPDGDRPADNWRLPSAPLKHGKVGAGALDACFCQCSMHHLVGIRPLAKTT